MNPKTTVILCVVFLLAIAGAIYLSQETKPVETTDVARSEALNNTSSDKPILDGKVLGPAVKQFIINFNDGILDAKQFDGQWLITRPHQFRCHTPMLDEMLSALGNLQGTVIDQTELDKLIDQTHDGVGKMLGQPEQVITLNPGVDPIHIRLHQRLGAGRGGITVIIDKQVTYYSADDSLHDFFETIDHYSFYPRSIKPILMPETRRIEIVTGESASVLTQRDGRWQIGEGEEAERALEVQLEQYPGVSNYFALLEAIEIQEFHEYNRDAGIQQFGLHKPLITARFVPMDGKPNNPAVGKMLRIGVPADPSDQTRFACYTSATDSYPLVFTIPTQIALAFGQDARAFRDPRIMITPLTLIESIHIGSRHHVDTSQIIRIKPDGSATLTHQQSQRFRELNPRKLSAAIKQLASARALDYLDMNARAISQINSFTIKSKLSDATEIFSTYRDPDVPATGPRTILVLRHTDSRLLRVEARYLTPILRVQYDEAEPAKLPAGF